MCIKVINKHFMIGLYGLVLIPSFCNAMDSDKLSGKGKKISTAGFRPDHEPEKDKEVQGPPDTPLHFDASRGEYYRVIPLSEAAEGSSGNLVKDDEEGTVYQLQKSQPLIPSSIIGGYCHELGIPEEQKSSFMSQFEHLDTSEKNVVLDAFKVNLSRLNGLKGKKGISQEIEKLFLFTRK